MKPAKIHGLLGRQPTSDPVRGVQPADAASDDHAVRHYDPAPDAASRSASTTAPLCSVSCAP